MGLGNLPVVWFLARGSVQFSSVPDPAKHLNGVVFAGLLPGLDITLQFFSWVVPTPWYSFTVPTPLAPTKYLSSERIMTCWRCRFS
jgi:hypothetical protein